MNTYNAIPTQLPITTTVNKLTDGDGVNANNLIKELAPGGTPNLTLAYLYDLIAGLAHGAPTVKITAAGQTIDTGMGRVFACLAPTVDQTLVLRDAILGGSPLPLEGDTMIFTRPATGAHVIQLLNGGGVSIVATLSSATRASLAIRYMDLNDGNGLTWRCVAGFGFTAGAVG